jgi:hypothetical protein
VDAQDRERESVDPDAEVDGDRGRADLAAELHPPGQAAKVVCHADSGGEGRAEQDPAVGTREVEERERGDEDGEEEREPSEAWDRLQVDSPALDRLVHDPEHARHPADRRCEHEDDGQRDQEAPDDVQVVPERVEHLLRSEQAVARVAEAGNDVALLVEPTIDCRDHDGDV